MYLGIAQEGSVREYIHIFHTLSEECKDFPDNYLMSVLVRGLKKTLHDQFRLLKPSNLRYAMNLALRWEDKWLGQLVMVLMENYQW